MKTISIGLALIALTGCSTVAVPVVKEALQCKVSADLLAACNEPAAITPGITFGEMIDISRRDRDSLKECALKQKSLAEAMAACNDSIDKHNAEIRELNARNAAKH